MGLNNTPGGTSDKHETSRGIGPLADLPEKVRTEWSLITLAYNLKRVLNLVSFEKLMAAVGVQVPQRA